MVLWQDIGVIFQIIPLKIRPLHVLFKLKKNGVINNRIQNFDMQKLKTLILTIPWYLFNDAFTQN